MTVYYKRIEYTLIGIEWDMQEVPKRGAHMQNMCFYIAKKYKTVIIDNLAGTPQNL